MVEERNTRQKEIIPPDRLETISATIVGVGAIGRQVALQLAAIGVPKMLLIDFDKVEVVNLAPQGFAAEDVGGYKVDVTSRACSILNPDIDVTVRRTRFTPSVVDGNTLFCCVDSMDARKRIWDLKGKEMDLFVDGRMSAEVLRVLSAHDEKSREAYPKTLFSDDEALQDRCTSRSTIYCANIAAGLMISRLTKYLRGMHAEPDILVNLLSMDVRLTA